MGDEQNGPSAIGAVRPSVQHVRRVLRVVGRPLFGAVNSLTNAMALFTATS